MLQTAASLGVLCLVTSIIYLVDFFYVLLQRSRILSEEYYFSSMLTRMRSGGPARVECLDCLTDLP